MANKEAIIFSIDVGNAIDKIYQGQKRRLQLALQCLELTLQQKLVNNPNHQFGFTIFGDNDSDDGNNQTLYPIQKPDLNLIRKIKQMANQKIQSKNKGGDIFSAIEHIIMTFRQYIGNKKYTKRAFLFTCGEGQTSYNEDQINSIAQNLQSDNIKLNIIPINFFKTYKIAENKLENQPFTSIEQKRNAQLLIHLKEAGRLNVQIFKTEIAVPLYQKFRTKDTNPVVLFKGQFQIAPGFTIPIATYKCIRKQRLLSLGKYDMSIGFNPVLQKQKEIINDVSYICEGDQSGTIVDKQSIIKAYAYGLNLIPVSNIIQPSMKLYEEKNFKLLGFVDKKNIPRQAFMGEVQIAVPIDLGKSRQQMTISKKIFTALIVSMKRQNKYAIARYVPRNSKNGVNPRFVTLIPEMKNDRIMLYLVDLPTVQDVRDYPFNPLKKSNQKQQQIVKDMVQKMLLVHTDQTNQQVDAFEIDNIPNPVRRYFYQTVFHRSIQNSEEQSIPVMNDVIRSMITPQNQTFDATKQLMKELKQSFRFVKKELAKQKSKQATLRWNDVLSTNRDTDQYSQSSYELMPQQKKFNLDNNKDEQFDPNNPITSFRAMLTNNKKDLVDLALRQMSQYIQKKGKLIDTQQQFDEIIQCAVKLRQGCDEQKEKEFWDQWFKDLPNRLPQNIITTLKNRGYGYFDQKLTSMYYKNTGQNLKKAEIEPQMDDLD